MYRRNFLKVLGAGTVGLGTGFAPSAAWAGLTLAPTGSGSLSPQRRIRSCKIIGIGGAGINVMNAFLSGVEKLPAHIRAEVLGIDCGLVNLSLFEAFAQTAQSRVPVKTISLAPYGAGSRVRLARMAAFRHLELLKSVVTGADAVMLVAGLGGGTSGGVPPVMARLARNAGATTAAAVGLPADFEGIRRGRNANTAVRYLQRETDDVKQFSCEELLGKMGDDITQDEFFNAQNQRIVEYIHSFLEKENDLA
jgi:cell division protein FtsZ